MAKCTYCGKEIILIPSAKERAEKFGGKPSDYTKLFTSHSSCHIKHRNNETIKLISRRKEDGIP